MQNGYLKIAALRGAPIRLHWTTPLGALLFSGFRYAPGAWAGFVAIVLAHEIGHALLALRHRVRVLGIDVHALGGQCRLADGATRRERIVIAWGGVLAQALVLVLAVLVLRPAASTPFTMELAETLVGTNLWLIALNLVPVAPLDGALAWQLFFSGEGAPSSEGPQRVNPGPPARDWFARTRARSVRADVARQVRELESADAEEPELGPEDEERLRRALEDATRRASGVSEGRS